MATHKSIVDLQRLAELQGWDVSHTGSGHLRWESPTGEIVSTSSTPSNEGTIRNIKNDLARAGFLLDRRDAKAVGKALKRGSNLRPLELTPAWTRPSTPISEWTDDQIMAGMEHIRSIRPEEDYPSTANLTRRERQAYANMIRHVEDYPMAGGRYWPTVCATCGYEADVDAENQCYELYKHLQNNRTHTSTPPDGMESVHTMKRDISNPPARERLNCPYCAEWFWLTQPEALATHAATDHAKASCPYCAKWFSTVKGGIGKHMRKCPAGGEAAAAAARNGRTEPDPTPAEPVVAVAKVPAIVKATTKAAPLAAYGNAKRSDDWNPDPCLGGCNSPVGNNPGKTHCTSCEALLDEIQAEADAAPAAASVAEVPAPAPVQPAPAPVQPAPAPAPEPARSTALSDDELFTLLEMVLDGPITLNRETFSAVNSWMEATRNLLAIKYGEG